MKSSRVAVITAVCAVVLLVGGYYAYQYAKYTPPEWLIKIATISKPPPPLPAGDAATISVPKGFVATIYSRETPGARVMTRDQKGTMLVTLTESGKVLALPDTNGDGKADTTIIVLQGLEKPHGLLVDCAQSTGNICTLYVAETGELKSYTYDADAFTATLKKSLMKFPTGDGHFTRTLLMAPDGKHLLISIGSSCNVCNEKDPLRASVQSYDLTTGTTTPYATGLRNSVFMAIDLFRGGIWATENGRDILGDDIPPDEINILESGKDYGWPLCYGQNIHDTDFDSKKYVQNPCSDKVPAYIDLPAHSAALGLAFIPEDPPSPTATGGQEGWPEDMWGDLLVAYHGSWNRSQPTGYKVVRFNLDPKTRKPIGAPIDFANGFLPNGSTEVGDAIGRPVGLMAEPGGVVYISDDRAGAIYKVSRTNY